MDKNISFRSAEVLRVLNESNQTFFIVGDVEKILKGSSSQNVRKLLSDMTKRKLIMILKDGLYTIIPYEKTHDYFPNWHLVAEKLAYPNKYYIGFYSALDLHGLITQPSLTEYIVSNKQFIPKKQIIKNIKFEFINYNEQHFFGFEKKWINNYDKVYCSDLEKTIIDCLYKPQFASGITEIVKAINRCKKEINSDKMFEYLNNFNANVVFKRLGFILENFPEFNSLTNSLYKKVSSSKAYLDPTYPKKGIYNSRWKIIDNVGIDEALNSITT